MPCPFSGSKELVTHRQGLTNQNLIYLSGAVLLLQNTEFFRGFPIYLIHFSGQVRKYFTCPAKIFTCPGQPDNGFVRPCIDKLVSTGKDSVIGTFKTGRKKSFI